MQRKSVVLPEPLGPMIATFCVRGTSRSMPHSTSVSPNRLCRSTIFSRGSMDRRRFPEAPEATTTGLASEAPAPVGQGGRPPSVRLQAAGAGRRLPAGVAVDAHARIRVRRGEPGRILHAVLRHDLHVLAVRPDLADLGVHGVGELLLVLVDAEDHVVLRRHDRILRHVGLELDLVDAVHGLELGHQREAGDRADLLALHVREGAVVGRLLLGKRGAEVVDRVRQKHDLRAWLDPAHGAMHHVELALLGRLNFGGPLHHVGLDLEAEPLGDQRHDLAVRADELAVLHAGHRHVAVQPDIEDAGLQRLGCRMRGRRSERKQQRRRQDGPRAPTGACRRPYCCHASLPILPFAVERRESDGRTSSGGCQPIVPSLGACNPRAAHTPWNLSEIVMSLLIKDATILTVDAARTIHRPGAIYVEGARIVDVGSSDAVAARHASAKRVIDGRDKVVAPGFVNIHSHVGYTIFRGRSEDAGFAAPTGLYFPMSTVLRGEERAAVGALNYVELLRSGCTTVMELEEDVEVLAPFVRRLGIRSAMGEMIGDADADKMVKGEFIFDPAANAAQLDRARGFAERWHGAADGRITAILAPNMTISSSKEQLRAIRELADRLGLRVTIHLGWSQFEHDTAKRIHGVGPFVLARDQGVLGPDTVATHCYVIGESDIDILAETGAHVAHCPLMNAFRGLIAPIGAIRKRGVNVALGIDNMLGDYFDVLRAAITGARIKTEDPVALLSPDVLEMATMSGARAMGLEDEIGSLEPGKRADLIMLDFRALGLQPVLDPVQNLAYHAHARDVELVMVDGRILVEDGEIRTVDPLAVIDDAKRSAASAWQRFEQKYGGPIARV